MKTKKILENKDLNVALIAPSRGTTPEKLSRAIKRMKDLGFKEVLYRKSLLNKKLGYWSGTYTQRVEEINKFFQDQKVDIIWCLNGGISSLELIPGIDFREIKKNKKIFIGFSDITSLQQAFLHYSKMESVQFYMPGTKEWFNNKQELELLRKIINLEDYTLKINPKKIYQEGFAKSTLVGGCLELIANTLGTKHEINTKKKILYLEDTGFTPQKIYHYLSLLHNAEKFKEIKGLILAKMENCGNYLPYIKIFLKKITDKKIPIIIELNSGHYKIKAPIILGGKCTINTKENKIVLGFSDDFKKELR